MGTFNEDLTNFQAAIGVNNPIFSATPSDGTVGGIIPTIPRIKLKPKSRTINVKDNFFWKNASDAIATQEVPSLILEERTLSMRGIAATVANIYNTVNSSTEKNIFNKAIDVLNDPYAKLYVTEPDSDIFVYRFPWLLNSGSNLRTIQNSWEDQNNNPISNTTSNSNQSEDLAWWQKAVGGLAGFAAGALTPGIGMDPIYTYKSTQNFNLSVSFPLYNTFNTQSTIENFYLVALLTYQNLKNRTSLVTYVPPSVYTIASEGMGGVYIPLAIMSNLTINNIGTVRMIKDDIIPGKDVLVPEAYQLNMTFQELLPQSSNIFQGAMGGTKLRVTESVAGTSNLSNTQTNQIGVLNRTAGSILT